MQTVCADRCVQCWLNGGRDSEHTVGGVSGVRSLCNDKSIVVWVVSAQCCGVSGVRDILIWEVCGVVMW